MSIGNDFWDSNMNYKGVRSESLQEVQFGGREDYRLHSVCVQFEIRLPSGNFN